MRSLLRQAANAVAFFCPRCRRHSYRQFTYSQDGEDRHLLHFFEARRSGFFVDVGAFHPKQYSNTYLFYEMGWRGINIDPAPGVAELFRRIRPLDVSLPAGIALESGEREFFVYDEPAYNTFSRESKEMMARRGFPRLVEERKVRVLPLAQVLTENCPMGTEIDFLSVDAEGTDFDVLKSNDWDRFRPRVVLAENAASVDQVLQAPATRFLAERGYELFAKTNLSAFYRRL